MKALLSRMAGGPENLVVGELPDPAPGAEEIVIAVRACGVNFPDTLILEDQYQYRPTRPFSPGGEVAGTVTALGSNVAGMHVGDRVMGWCAWGGMAEKVAVAATRCVKMPDAMPFDEGAAFIMTYGTSHYALAHRGQLAAGETLLILGAAGGAGLAAVELGRAMGAHVVAAVSSDEKLAFATRHGAEQGVVYPRGPFEKAALRDLSALFKQACPATGADVIYDAVGGDYAEAALRAIAWGGRFLVVGFPAGVPRLSLNLALLKSCQIIGVFWGAWIDRDPAGFQASAQELLGFYSRGAIRPVISRRFVLENGGDAIAALTARTAMGKLVVMLE